MPIKTIPELKHKKTHDIDPDSLTAAVKWDKLANASMSDADLPLAVGKSGAEEEEEGE